MSSVPQYRRAGMPKHKKKREADPSLNYTRRGFRLKDGRLHLAGNIALTVPSIPPRTVPSTPGSSQTSGPSPPGAAATRKSP
jgi:putative transposase